MSDVIQKQLDQAQKDYTRGDFKEAVPVAQGVAENGEAQEKQKSKALKLLLGMSIDPVATAVFGTTIFVTLFLVLKFLL